MFLGLQQLMDSLPAFGNFWAACVCHVCVSAARTILPHDLSNIYTHAQYWTGCCSSAIGRRRLRSLLRLISGGYICSRGMYCVDLFAHLSEFLLPHVVLDATGGHVTSSGQESDRQRCRTRDRIRTGSGAGQRTGIGQAAVPDRGQDSDRQRTGSGAGQRTGPPSGPPEAHRCGPPSPYMGSGLRAGPPFSQAPCTAWCGCTPVVTCPPLPAAAAGARGDGGASSDAARGPASVAAAIRSPPVYNGQNGDREDLFIAHGLPGGGQCRVPSLARRGGLCKQKQADPV